MKVRFQRNECERGIFDSSLLLNSVWVHLQSKFSVLTIWSQNVCFQFTWTPCESTVVSFFCRLSSPNKLSLQRACAVSQTDKYHWICSPRLPATWSSLQESVRWQCVCPHTQILTCIHVNRTRRCHRTVFQSLGLPLHQKSLNVHCFFSFHVCCCSVCAPSFHHQPVLIDDRAPCYGNLSSCRRASEPERRTWFPLCVTLDTFVIECCERTRPRFVRYPQLSDAAINASHGFRASWCPDARAVLKTTCKKRKLCPSQCQITYIWRNLLHLRSMTRCAAPHHPVTYAVLSSSVQTSPGFFPNRPDVDLFMFLNTVSRDHLDLNLVCALDNREVSVKTCDACGTCLNINFRKSLCGM